MPSRNAVRIGSMPSAWVLARGPYNCAKASFAKVPTTTVGTPPAVLERGVQDEDLDVGAGLHVVPVVGHRRGPAVPVGGLGARGEGGSVGPERKFQSDGSLGVGELVLIKSIVLELRRLRRLFCKDLLRGHRGPKPVGILVVLVRRWQDQCIRD